MLEERPLTGYTLPRGGRPQRTASEGSFAFHWFPVHGTTKTRGGRPNGTSKKAVSGEPVFLQAFAPGDTDIS